MPIPPPPPPMSAEVITELEEELDEEYVMEDFVLPSGLSVVAAITCIATKDSISKHLKSIYPFLTCDAACDFSDTFVLPSSVVYAFDFAAMASCISAPSGTSTDLGASIVKIPWAE